ncbi:hypothetical protein QJS10_CPB19g01883 [Acorus calamus]|uniref:HMA domain-containing protein n=1 Tax=Acorus calamus TaxID=4465 RepID=A0AAV9CGV5_ACOCL|nr:hypothetical protein QJS10_CPB19g01883 [Acorus calamus]
MASELLKFTLSPNPNPKINSTFYRRSTPLRSLPLPLRRSSPCRSLNLLRAKAVEIGAPSVSPPPPPPPPEAERSILLEVGGMMCGGCAARVKTVLSSDDRVETAAVNMVTETAAVRLRRSDGGGDEAAVVGEDLARRLTECGFPSKRRVSAGGVGENVRKWREMAEKKEELLRRSRNRVAFAWTLVALCCGSHASHLLHSIGIHSAHGSFWELLHNSYVKGGLALVSLLGPGRDILLDGLRAFTKRSPNMNSLVGFGSIAAFIISAVSLLNPGLEWKASFFDEPDGPLKIEASTTGSMSMISKIIRMVLLNDMAGPDGNSLLLSLKLSVDVLTGTLTEGKPAVTDVASLSLDESEVLLLAAAVEKTASHPLAKAIINKAESLNLKIPSTRGQLTEPGFGSLAEVNGTLVAVGTLDWVHGRFQNNMSQSSLKDLEISSLRPSSNKGSSNHSQSTVYVGREGQGIIGAISISDTLRHDAKSTVKRLQQKGVKTILLSGDMEEAVANIGRAVGIPGESIKARLTPQQKSGVISDLQSQGHRVAMVGDGINDAPSLALADVGIALPTETKENAASDAASVILLGNRLSQLIEALDLARATMGKVHQNLAWAVAYNIVAIPIAAGILLPQYDFAMTPSLSGGLMALSSIFVVTNSLLLQLHGFSKQRKE